MTTTIRESELLNESGMPSKYHPSTYRVWLWLNQQTHLDELARQAIRSRISEIDQIFFAWEAQHPHKHFWVRNIKAVHIAFCQQCGIEKE
jgi:hypothetical protein